MVATKSNVSKAKSTIVKVSLDKLSADLKSIISSMRTLDLIDDVAFEFYESTSGVPIQHRKGSAMDLIVRSLAKKAAEKAAGE